MPDDVSVLVVGAGPAGLSAAGALARLGIRATVLERDAEVGVRWAERYDRLRLHTIRRFSGLAHYPLPRELGRYVAKDEFAAISATMWCGSGSTSVSTRTCRVSA